METALIGETPGKEYTILLLAGENVISAQDLPIRAAERARWRISTIFNGVPLACREAIFSGENSAKG